MFCQYVLLWIFISQNRKLSRFLSTWLDTSANLHPHLLHLLHLTMCCFAENTSLPQSLHRRSPLFCTLLVSPFSCFSLFFFFFPHLLFCSHWAAFMEVLFGTCPPCSWTLHPLLPPHHFSPCSSIHMLRNQSALITHYIYRGEELQFLKENCGGIQTSKGVSFCWINLGRERRSNLLFCEMNAPTSQ